MKILLPILFCTFFNSISFSQTILSGKVTDAESGEAIIFGTVAIYKNDVLYTGTETGFDGYYSITAFDAGVYDVVFSYTGYTDKKASYILVIKDKNTQLDAKISSRPISPCCGINCFPYRNFYSSDNLTQGFTFRTHEIRRMAIGR